MKFYAHTKIKASFIFALTKIYFSLILAPMRLLNTREAAELKGVSIRRIQQLIEDGSLPAQKVSRDYAILEKDLNKVKVYRKVGRPPKSEAA